MKIARCLLLLAIAFGLSGCMEFTEEIWVNNDGSGAVQMDVAVSEMIVAMSADGTGGSELSEMQERWRELEDDIGSQPNVVSVRVDDYLEEGMYHFVLAVEVLDITKVGNMPGPMAMDEENSEEMAMSITRLENGNIAFSQLIENPEESIDADAADGGGGAVAVADTTANALLQSMCAGKYFTIILHGPQIARANGTVDASRTTATWQIPLVELSARADFMQNIYAEVGLPSTKPLAGLTPALPETMELLPRFVEVATGIEDHRSYYRAGGPLYGAGIPATALYRAQVIRDRVRIYRGPGEDQVVIRVAALGAVFPVLEETEDWLRIVLRDGRRGWVRRAETAILRGTGR